MAAGVVDSEVCPLTKRRIPSLAKEHYKWIGKPFVWIGNVKTLVRDVSLEEVRKKFPTWGWARVHGWPMAGIAQKLRKHPLVVKNLSCFRQAIQEVPQFGIHILTIPPDLVDAAAAIGQQTGLLSNDALIVALMQRYGLTKLASHDPDFDRVPGITRFAPA